MLRQRLYAFFWHCLFSILLLAIALYLVFMVWYPSPLAQAVGVGNMYVLMLIIDLILGPTLTFIVYKLDKKRMLFDMVVIVLIQLIAYVGGLFVLHQGKPAWLVFVKDDIELVSPINIQEKFRQDLTDQFKVPFYKKPMWIAADYGSDPRKRQKLIDEEMFDGISIAVRPETYKLIDTKSEEILIKLKPIAELHKFNIDVAIDEQLALLTTKPKGWLPVKSPELDMVALFDKNGKPIKIVNLRPWFQFIP